MSDELGKCCACGGRERVRNIILLEKESPKAGTGWGCFSCGLPPNGAVAVVCDYCLETGAPIDFACVGYPKDNERIAIALLTRPHRHDHTKHPKVVNVNLN